MSQAWPDQGPQPPSFCRLILALGVGPSLSAWALSLDALWSALLRRHQGQPESPPPPTALHGSVIYPSATSCLDFLSHWTYFGVFRCIANFILILGRGKIVAFLPFISLNSGAGRGGLRPHGRGQEAGRSPQGSRGPVPVWAPCATKGRKQPVQACWTSPHPSQE